VSGGLLGDWFLKAWDQRVIERTCEEVQKLTGSLRGVPSVLLPEVVGTEQRNSGEE
jgi:hypothetical protein